MADASSTTYNIRSLPTRSVTLFPTRAQVVREVSNIPLQAGSNEITIVGLTPTADEHSIKVEGSGSAIISNIATELLPNREIFEEIYPEEDDEDDGADDGSSDDDHDDDEIPEGEELKAVRKRLEGLRDERRMATEAMASAEARLKILDGHGKTLTSRKNVVIEDGLSTYKEERGKAFRDQMDGVLREREIAERIAEAAKEEAKLERALAKLHAAREKQRSKRRELREKEARRLRRRRDEKRAEKERVRKERENFWPKVVYSVRITLEASSFTPSTSRRSSFAEGEVVTEKALEKAPSSATAACDLLLTYVTTSAFWSPSYDLQLSTTSNTATLCFDASLTNMTSEAWSNAKVTLSTPQAAFAGLDDPIPTLVPWKIKLAARGTAHASDILNSREERHEREVNQHKQQSQAAQKPRADLFGVSRNAAPQDYQMQLMLLEQQNKKRLLMAKQEAEGQYLQQQHRGGAWGANNMNMAMPMAQATGASLPGGLFGGAPPPPPPPPPPGPAGGLFGAPPRPGGGGLFGAPPQPRGGPAFDASFKSIGGFGGAYGAVEANRSAVLSKAAAAPKAKKKKAVFGASASALGRGGASSIRRDRASSAFSDGADSEEAEEADDDGYGDEAGDDGTILEAVPELDFQESEVGETGFTTTYELPGQKTLVPKSTASKQRVARMNFSAVVFSHTIVAKYQPAAYLKAKVKNTSKLTLLRGAAGLTLDGSFMGRTMLPRCSAGDTFSMPLGVDPAIKVIYPKPDVRRHTTGVFSKEDSSVYTRSVTVSNTKASSARPTQLLVLDQIPISEDERLRVEMLAPRGLALGGGGVAAGGPARETGQDRDWGKATALLKKGGEVAWEVALNPGKAVRLGLEYVVAAPSGEAAVQCA